MSDREWQPIESAPKDGSDVQVYCSDENEQMVAFWNRGYWQFASHNGISIVCDPTHWMPLPATPKS